MLREFMNSARGLKKSWQDHCADSLTHLLIVAILFSLTGCIEKSRIDVTLKKSKITTNPLNITISNVQVINHQIVITGTNLTAVSDFQIKEGSNNATLQIESQTSTSIVANTLSNVTFAAGKMFDFVFSSAQAASTFTVNFSLCDSTLGGKGFNCAITPTDKQVLSYDAFSGKWKPRNVNGLNYLGAWDANDPLPTATEAGEYYIVSNAAGIYQVGDWIVFNGSNFDEIDNSQAIISVFGRTGAVTALEGDYNLTKLSDVTITAPATNQVLTYNGASWVNGAVAYTESDPLVSAFAKATLPTCGVGQVLKGDGTSLSCVTDNAGTSFTGTANRVVITDGAGALGSSSISTTILNYLSNVTSDVQTQLNSKLSSYTETDPGVTAFAKAALPNCNAGEVLKGNGTSLSCVTDNAGAGAYTGTINRVVLTDGTTGALTVSTVTNTEAGYLSGVTSAIQTQLNAKQASITTASALTTGSIQTNLQNAVAINPFNTAAGNTGEFRFYELVANGTNYTGFKSPDLLGANIIYTMPGTAPTAGQVLSSTAGGVLSWIAIPSAPVSTVFGRSGAVVAASGDYSATQVTNTAAGNIAATTVQAALNELDSEKQSIGTFAGDVRGVLLAGLSTATNAVIATGDSILVAFGKIQAQVSALSTSVSNKADLTNGAQSITASNITTTTINGGVIPDLSKAVTNEGGVASLQVGTLAARPVAAAGNTGRVYLVNDSGNEAVYISTGSVWVKIAQSGLSGTVGVANGGTGSTTFTANKVVVVNGAANALVDGPSLDDTTAAAATVVKRGPSGEVYGQNIIPTSTVTETGACTTLGAMAKDANGNILSCQN